MDTKTYNSLQTIYVSLTERFSHFRDYSYCENYKCYNNAYFFLHEEYKDELEKFKNLTINDIYPEEVKTKYNYPQAYLSNKLIKFKENKVCIIYGFGQIIFYYILSKLENKLDSFIIELEKLENNGNIIREEHRIIFKFQSIFQNWISSIVLDNEMNMLIHLFTKTNSSIISINIDGYIDIDYSQIMNIKKNISDYEFNKVK